MAENRTAQATQKFVTRDELIKKIQQEHDRGYSNAAIAFRNKISESSVRVLLKK